MHPVSRGFALLLFSVGCFFSTSIILLAAGWVALLPLLRQYRLLSIHIKFVAFGVGPLFAALVVIWAWAADHPPLVPIETYNSPGFSYALLVAIRIAALGGIMQLVVLPIAHTRQLGTTLRRWGFGPTLTQVLVSSICLLDDLRRKTNQVVEARMARGLLPPSKLRRVLALPGLLRPVVTMSVLSAAKRADLWNHRGIDPVAAAEDNSGHETWGTRDWLAVFGAMALAIVGAISRLYVN